jgi:phosphatidylglycerophosphate synthase
MVLYLYATVSDALDGALARHLGAETRGGAALDIACDKYLTIYSLFFLVAVGAPLVPICLALTRDIFVQAFRSVTVDGRHLFRPIRAIGLAVVIPIRFTVGYALLLRLFGVWSGHTVSSLCWICGGISFSVLTLTILHNADDLRRAFNPP